MRPALLVTAFVLLALAESALGLIQPRAVATEADWKEAAAYVRAGFQPGDLITFAPGWIDQVGRKHLGDLMPATMVARSDDDRYRRVWELSVHGAADPRVQPSWVEEERDFGRVHVRRYDRGSQVRVLRDLSTDFVGARVFTRPRDGEEGKERPCLVDGDGRRCAATRVEPRVMEIDYRPRRGILVPVASREITSLAYEEVPGGLLVGYVGLHDYYARKNADGVAIVRVRVDGTQTVTLPVHNEDGWKRFELSLEAGAHRVVIEVESDQPAQRLVGIHAEVRAP